MTFSDIRIMCREVLIIFSYCVCDTNDGDGDPNGQNDVVATLFRRRYRRRYNVEIMVTMNLVTTSFVNVFSPSSNDVV